MSKLGTSMNNYPNNLKININLYTCFLLFGITNIFQSSVSGDVLPLWTWECVNEKCLPRKTSHLGKSQSLETCNMLCASMQIWPQPTGVVSLSTTAVPVRADLFQLHTLSTPSKIVHEHIEEVFQMFHQDLTRVARKSRGYEEWRSVAVRIVVNGSGDPRMRHDTNEGYSLSVRPIPGAALALMVDIVAHSFCGARHALETLLQLVWLDTYMGTLLMLEAARIDDSPRFGYRGILVDTARTYFPMDELLQNIDAMAASKLNTFHWHMSDSQAFPLHTNSVPQLAQFGAHSVENVYTPQEVREIVRRARLRGIRVIIEIDSPAHVGHAWKFGKFMNLGDLVFCLDDEPWNTYCSEPPCGQLNPRNKNVFKILTRVYSEIVQLTGVDDVFHIGGDEISQACYRDHFPDQDPTDLWAEYTNELLNRLVSETLIETKPNLTIFWASTLIERARVDLRNHIHSIAVQVRDSKGYPVLNNLRTIISHEDPWDFNTGYGLWYENNNVIPYNSWQRMYEHRPWEKFPGGTVLGGEATVWSSDLGQGNLISRVWPRAAAFAERLWTDRANAATALVHARLDVHRSRLLARGIEASPLWSMWCSHNTHTCKI